MKKFLFLLTAVLFGIVLNGCERFSDKPAGQGSIRFVGKVSAAISAAGVSSVTVSSVSCSCGGSYTTDIAVTPSAGVRTFDKTVHDIPDGDWVFEAKAYNNAVPPVELFTTTATVSVTVTAGSSSIVQLYLSDVGGANHDFTNYTPVLTSLTTTLDDPKQGVVGPFDTTAAPGAGINFGATFLDFDAGDTLSYVWTVTGPEANGPYSSSDTPSGDFQHDTGLAWVAPETIGTYTITVTATDSKNAMAAGQFIVHVGSGTQLQANFNAFPTVDGKGEGLFSDITSPLGEGQIANLRLIASDADGDNLTVTIASSTCGDFDVKDNTIEGGSGQIDFTFTANGGFDTTQGLYGFCKVSATIDDGHGGTNQADLFLPIGGRIIRGE